MENKTEEIEEIEDDEIIIDEPEEKTSEVDELAIEMGWNPDYEGDDAVDAKTFILNAKEIEASLKKRSRTKDREIKKLTKTVSKVIDHYKKLDQARVKKMEAEIKRLQKKRNEAIEDGDVDKVVSLEEKIDEAAEEAQSFIDEQEDSPPEWDEWIEENKWYATDKELRAYADAQAELPKYKGLSPDRILKLVEKATKEMFPDKFGTKKGSMKPKASNVEPTKPSGRKRKLTKADLTTEEKQMLDQLIAVDDTITVDSFLKDLEEIRNG